MVVRNRSEMNTRDRENMRGGKGVVHQIDFVAPEELLNSGRLFAEFVIKPGDSIGMHRHDGESEFYVILEGEGTYYMDDESYQVSAGDLTVVHNHHTHGIENTGDQDLRLIGLVIYDNTEE